MTIRKVYAVFFSPVGSTKRLVSALSDAFSERFLVERETIDFTTPNMREKAGRDGWRFTQEDLVVFGTPTYAGRVPNKVLPFMQELFHAEGTPAVALTTYGNRSADSSLTELSAELQKNGFHVFAAASFVCRHVFSPEKIAPGRPDEGDFALINTLADRAFEKTRSVGHASELTFSFSGTDAEIGPYYTPLGTDGKPASFLKAKPKTKESLCDRCGVCVNICPMGSVDDDCVSISGICIKCQACVLNCHTNAKYFDDPAFLSHVQMLEENYAGDLRDVHVLI